VSYAYAGSNVSGSPISLLIIVSEFGISAKEKTKADKTNNTTKIFFILFPPYEVMNFFIKKNIFAYFQLQKNFIIIFLKKQVC
jgi:hypothetical protein